jgi:integrase
MYGHTLAKAFAPLALKAVREWMIHGDWTRGYVNSCVGCIKRMFKWGVENELVPPSVYHGLLAVSGLKRGRTEARETKSIRPVEDCVVRAVLPFLGPTVRAMVQVQWLSSMRPGEVILMRPCDIDQKGKTWVYRPESHKTEHHDIERVIFLGPQAQDVLKPFLFRGPNDYLFSPREVMVAFRARQRQERRTKVQPIQMDRKKRNPRKWPGERYTTDSYRRAIERACHVAFPFPFPTGFPRLN